MVTHSTLKAARLIGVVQLDDVRLVGISAKNSRPPEEGSRAELFVRNRSGCPTEHTAGEAFFVSVSLDAKVASASDDPVPFFEVAATFELTYCVPDGFRAEPEELSSFGNVNAVFNAWPYFREITQSMAARMGLPPVILPVFRVPLGVQANDVAEDTAERKKLSAANGR